MKIYYRLTWNSVTDATYLQYNPNEDVFTLAKIS